MNKEVETRLDSQWAKIKSMSEALDKLAGEYRTLRESIKYNSGQLDMLNRKVFPTCNYCGQRLLEHHIKLAEQEQVGQIANKEYRATSNLVRP
jgi:hypothetical protein